MIRRDELGIEYETSDIDPWAMTGACRSFDEWEAAQERSPGCWSSARGRRSERPDEATIMARRRGAALMMTPWLPSAELAPPLSRSRMANTRKFGLGAVHQCGSAKQRN